MDYKIFGCRLNKFYLNEWLNYFKNKSSDKDFLIVSCEVTDRAKSKWIKLLKQKIDKWFYVYLTWCASLQKWNLIDKQLFYQIYPELSNYQDRITLLPQSPNSQGIDNFHAHDNLTKKFLLIQTGCDTNCTFCLTVKKRWPSKNRSIESIIDEINQADYQWKQEIVLTWTNLTAWGCENTRQPSWSKFSYLLKQILKNTNIPRIRISSLSVEFLDEEFFDIIKESRIMPFFHFSVQSFSDKILKLMNRNYNLQKLINTLQKVVSAKRTDNIPINLWADIIVWFPNETEKDFFITYDWIKEFGISNLHVFPFSKHKKGEGITAWNFKNQIDKNTIIQRQKTLMSLSKDLKDSFLQKNKWKMFKVLLESNKDWIFYGWSENYIQMSVQWNYQTGQVVSKKFDF